MKAFLYFLDKKNGKSAKTLQKALSYYENTVSKGSVWEIYANILLSKVSNEDNITLTCLLNSLELAEELQEKPLICYLQSSIASYFFKKNSFSESEKYIKSSIQHYVELFGEKCDEVAEAEFFLGVLYYKMRDSNRSQEYLNKSFESNVRNWGDNNMFLVEKYFNLSEIYLEDKKFEEATACLLNAKSIGEKLKANKVANFDFDTKINEKLKLSKNIEEFKSKVKGIFFK